MKRIPMNRAQMEALATHMMAEDPGLVATVTPNARHIIAIKEPDWLPAMKARLAERGA